MSNRFSSSRISRCAHEIPTSDESDTEASNQHGTSNGSVKGSSQSTNNGLQNGRQQTHRQRHLSDRQQEEAENLRQQLDQLRVQNARQEEDAEAFRRQREEFRREREAFQQYRQQHEASMQQQSFNRSRQQLRQSNFQQSFGPPPTRHRSLSSIATEASTNRNDNRQTQQHGPIRVTDNSLAPVNTMGIYSNIRNDITNALFPIVNDTVTHVHLRQSNVRFHLKNGQTVNVSTAMVTNFLTVSSADSSLLLQSDAAARSLHQQQFGAWREFLRQTVTATFVGNWEKFNVFNFLDSLVNLRKCYFKQITWATVWMNELGRHLPMVSNLLVDTRQSGNSSFLHVVKHVTLAAHNRQHNFVNLILFVTDFPVQSALDDYLYTIQEYVTERCLILVNLVPDDAYLRVLRPRNFAPTGVTAFDGEEYVIFEPPNDGPLMSIGFLVPSNRTENQ